MSNSNLSIINIGENPKTRVIKNLNDLSRAFNFLEKNLPLSNNICSKLFNYLKVANKELGFYGYIFETNNKTILGAILTPVQYKSKRSQKHIVINLCALYIAKKIRGIESLRFIKEVLDKLSEYIITAYSSSIVSANIFKYFGLKDMKSVNISMSFFYCFSFKSLFKSDLKVINKSDLKFINYKLKGFSNISKLNFNKINVEGKDCFIGGIRKLIYSPKFFNLIRIPIPIYQVLWASDEKIFTKIAKATCFKLIKHYKVFLVNFDISKKNSSRLKINKNSIFFFKKAHPSIYKYQIKTKSNLGDYFPPIGSELSIDLILRDYLN